MKKSKKVTKKFAQYRKTPYLCNAKTEKQQRFLLVKTYFGAIAQLVEQRTENPCVPGSIPGGTTKRKKDSVAQLVEQLTLNQWVESSSLSGVTIKDHREVENR